MATRSKKLSVKDASKTSTESPKKKSKLNESLSNTKETSVSEDVFPVGGKPSNDIDSATVTLSEAEYDRLRSIDEHVKKLFKLAKDVNGVVAFGRPREKLKEHAIILKLRELTGLQ